MTKQDVLDSLNAKYARVLGVTERQEPNVLMCTANCLDIQGDTAVRSNVGFYVFDEGTPAEVAYWMNAEPKPVPVETFQQEVVAFLRGRVADGTILFYGAVATLAAEERAVASVVLDQAGTFVEARVAIWKDVSDQFQYQTIQPA